MYWNAGGGGWGSLSCSVLGAIWLGAVALPAAAEDSPVVPAPVAPAPVAPAPVAPAPAALEFVDYRLANGLRVILSPRAGASGVTVAVGYATGKGHDPVGYRGLAHLVEHLTFRASRHLKPFEGIAIMERAAVGYQGYTSAEHTVYVSSGASNRLATLLWLEAERMAFGIDGVTEQALALEKDIVTNEVTERGGTNLFSLQRRRKLYGPEHPLAALPDESNDDVQAVSLAGVQWFMQGAYRSDNATLAITGSFSAVDAQALVERYFASIKNHPVPKLGTPAVSPPKLCGVHRIDVAHPFILSQRLAFDWPVDGKWTFGADVALDSIGQILEDRLRKTLVEGNKAAWVSVGLTRLSTHSLLSLEVELQQPADWNGVERLIGAELSSLVTHGPSPLEARTARARLLSEHALTASDSSSSVFAFAEGRVESPLASRRALQALDGPALTVAARRLSRGYLVSRFMPKSGTPAEGEVLTEQDPCQ